jgi:hypothetical protein
MRRLLLIFLAAASLLAQSAKAPVYWLLWFDTEDFIEASSNDASMRLAQELERMRVPATFKIVGEKARYLEREQRQDVIRAIARYHDVGYHTENHSIPPTGAVYQEELGLLDGAAEFERREGAGLRDLQRIFGVNASCYGQPGSSWGPQANIALRKMGIPVYLDEGRQVGYNEQPFWYGGLLYVFNLRQYMIRVSLDEEADLAKAKERFRQGFEKLRATGGVMHTVYHPTEFVSKDFWDAVNFSRGANPDPKQWKSQPLRNKESSEKAYRLFFELVKYVRDTEGVQVVTARQLPQLFAHPLRSITPEAARDHLRRQLGGADGHSAADLLLAALGMTPQYVDGPDARVTTTWKQAGIPRWLWERSRKDVIDYIQFHHRLPAWAWLGNDKLSLPDFAATLAGDSGSGEVMVRSGKLAEESRISTEPCKHFDWLIHPQGFCAPKILEMARLQAWTLKPAQLR